VAAGGAFTRKAVAMTTARLVSLFLLFSLTAAPVHAEQLYEVWEDSGNIWARELPEGDPWQISRGTNCHDPDVDGPVAIWIADWSYSADVMYRRLNGGSRLDMALSVSPAVQSDPQVGYVGISPNDEIYGLWRQQGGIWGRRVSRHDSSWYIELVPNYSGPYTLEGDMLTWDGGTMQLTPENMPTAVPEPDAFTLICASAFSLCVLHWMFFRRD